tara:strand:+ start:2898 stop:3059 length:162 start_codon:yes stop_codon:yes gene_type:complete
MIKWLYDQHLKLFFNREFKQIRARDEKGRYIADDKSTPDKNEAYINISAELNK